MDALIYTNTGVQDEAATDEHGVSKGVWQRKGHVWKPTKNVWV